MDQHEDLLVTFGMVSCPAITLDREGHKINLFTEAPEQLPERFCPTLVFEDNRHPLTPLVVLDYVVADLFGLDMW